MKRIVWLEVILLATLVGCIPRFQSEKPPQGIRPETKLDTKVLNSAISGEQLIREQEGNCPVDEIEIPGEGSNARGTLGGLAIAPNPPGIMPEDPLAIGSEMFAMAAPTLTQPTAIIIVDDFNGDTQRQQPGVYFLDQQRDQPTLAGLDSTATEAEVENLEAIGQYSHGALVFNHTLALLSAEDPNPELSVIRVPVPDREEFINLPILTFTKLRVAVAALDTQDFNTDIIGGRLQATIQVLARQQIQRFAVNLSFGLVPCSVLADIKAVKQSNLTFEEYQEAVFTENVGRNDGGLSAEEFRDQLVNLLTTPVNADNDPLLVAAKTNPEGLANAAVNDITYLAASGNYALPYSLYPGYWSEFVSTSAQNLADTSRPAVRDPDYSNTGEVLVPGGYYTLTAYDPDIRNFRTYSEVSVAGTSFAAPVMSVFTALDFTGTTPRCARVAPSVVSPLAFFKTDVRPTPLPASGLDITLESALNVHHYCR